MDTLFIYGFAGNLEKTKGKEMEQRIITAEAARKLTDKKSGGVPPEIIDEVLGEVYRTIRLVASYEGHVELTVDVGRLFFTNTGVIFSDDDEHKAAREVAKTLRKAGYKVRFEPNLEYFDYREGMIVSWRK